MPTPSLAPVVEGTEDTMDTNPGPKYNYDVKIEFVLKSPGEKVYAKAIMVKTMKAIQSTIRKGEFVTFLDVIEVQPVHPELRGIAPEEVADKFCFEVGGPDRSIAFFGLAGEVGPPDVVLGVVEFFCLVGGGGRNLHWLLPHPGFEG